MVTLSGGVSYFGEAKFFDRLCRIVITLGDGTVLQESADSITYTKEFDGIDVTAMHCKFRVTRNFPTSRQYGELTIYNLEPMTERRILTEAQSVIIEAGYNHPDLYGRIYQGQVTQVIRGKENPTDYFVKIMMISDNDSLLWGVTSFSARRGTNYRELLDLVAQNSSPVLEVDTVKMPDDWGTDTQLIRGQVFHGSTSDVIEDIGESTNSIIKIESGKIYAVQLQETKTIEAYEMNYNTGLVGQPKQTNEGMSFRCLINPHLTINSWVHINNKYILEQERDVFSQQIGLNLDTDGLYRVIGQTIFGDTRGNDWYMDCDTITQAGTIPDMLYSNNARGL